MHMRIFLSILLLLFSLQSWTKANDISEFQIEGMSIGDSALDFFTNDTLKKNVRQDQYKGSDGKFFDVLIKKNYFTNYNKISLVFKKNDTSYKIYSISGVIYFDDDSKKCIEKYKKVLDDVDNLFVDYDKNILNDVKHPSDPTGETRINSTTFFHKSGSTAEIACYSPGKSYNMENYVLVGVDSAEFTNWILRYYEN